jgi:hypothetical protein
MNIVVMLSVYNAGISAKLDVNGVRTYYFMLPWQRIFRKNMHAKKNPEVIK